MTSFIDTNILVYAYDDGDATKQALARDLLSAHASEIVLSTQVLSEFYSVVTTKLEPALPVGVAREAVAYLTSYLVVASDRPAVLRAIDTSIHHQLSYWDALIVDAARAAGCATLYTEDLSHGQTFEGVRVVNPFV